MYIGIHNPHSQPCFRLGCSDIVITLLQNGIGGAMGHFCHFDIAHHLAMTGDTLEMIRAVLIQTWLATHVVVITWLLAMF